MHIIEHEVFVYYQRTVTSVIAANSSVAATALQTSKRLPVRGHQRYLQQFIDKDRYRVVEQ